MKFLIFPLCFLSLSPFPPTLNRLFSTLVVFCQAFWAIPETSQKELQFLLKGLSPSLVGAWEGTDRDLEQSGTAG